MRIVSYNIQFGLGRDGRLDLGRIADVVRRADIICLQEVDRYWRRSGMQDQAEVLGTLLPDRYWVYGAGLDVDASQMIDGRVVNRRRQFGNMTLSRWPILSSRCHVLPKADTGEAFNALTPALETVIGAPSGAIRLFNLHLTHTDALERLMQIEALRRPLLLAGEEGGAWQGTDVDDELWQCGDPAPPNPVDAILLGDFNAEPDSAEYSRLTAAEPAGLGLVDAWPEAHAADDLGVTFFKDTWQGADWDMRIDHIFLTRGLRVLPRASWIDAKVRASDHQPVWLELDVEMSCGAGGNGAAAPCLKPEML